MSSPGRGRGVELAADLDELLEVLDPPLRLDRALGLQRLDVAGPCEHRLEQLGDPHRPRGLAPAASDVLAARVRLAARRARFAAILAEGAHGRRRSSTIVSMKRPSALTAAAPSPGTCAGSTAASQTDTPSVSACAITRAERGLRRCRAAASWPRA